MISCSREKGSHSHIGLNMKIGFFFIPLLLTTLSCFAANPEMQFSGIKGAVNSEISKRVLEEAYRQLKIDVRILPFPGKRALMMSNSGRVDGELFRIANVHKRFRNLIPVPTSINVLQAIVFTKNIKFKIDGWHSLKPYRIGIQAGIRFADRGTKGMNRIVVDSNEQLFRMLNAGRVDIIVVAYTNGVKTHSLLNFEGIHALRPAVEEYPIHHYLHKKHRHLIPKIDTQFKLMQAAGRLKEIRKQVINEIKANKSKTAQ